MHKILAIMRKDILLRFASPIELIFFLALPILFTYIVAGFSSTQGGDNRIPVLVVNEDHSALAGELLARLTQSAAVRPLETTRADAEARFLQREAVTLLVMPAGFEAALHAGQPVTVEVRSDRANTNYLAAEQGIRAATERVSQALTAATLSVEEAARVRPFANDAARRAYFESSLAAARQALDAAPSRVEIIRPAAAASTRPFDGTAHASAGQLIVWVFIPLLGASELFAIERSTGTLRRLFTMPVTRGVYLLGTIGGQLSIGLVQMLLLAGFGFFVLKVNWGQSPLALLLLLITFGLASVAFGTMLGAFVKTPSQANGLSIMLGMTMGMLGGCMWPLEVFPPTVRTIVHILPTTWAMRGMTDLVMRGEGLTGIWPEIAVLLGFAAVFFLIGVRRFRYE
jgi:ABC-2 type transport system permease protein